MRRYCFDIDGTICTNTWGDYEDAEPYYERIDTVNKMYDGGIHITYLTARGMGNCGGDVSCAYDRWYNFTYDQLIEWGCKFDDLILGKPHADIYIDDKAFPDNLFFKNL